MSLEALVQILVPIVVPMVVGWLIVRAGLVKQADSVILTRLFIYVLAPALIIDLLAGEDLSELLEWRIGVAITLCYVLVWALVMLMHRVVLGRDTQASALSAILVSSVNRTILGLPILVALFQHRAVGPIAVSFVSYMVFIVPLTLMVAGMASSEGKGLSTIGAGLLKAMLNPLVIATIVGVGLVALGVKLPGVVDQTLMSFGRAGAVVALIGMGMRISLRDLRLTDAEMLWMSGLVLVVAPVIALLMALLLGLSHVSAAMLIVLFAMPPAQSAHAMCTHEGRYAKATSIVAFSTIALVIVVPAWIFLIHHLWPNAFTHLQPVSSP